MYHHVVKWLRFDSYWNLLQRIPTEILTNTKPIESRFYDIRHSYVNKSGTFESAHRGQGVAKLIATPPRSSPVQGHSRPYSDRLSIRRPPNYEHGIYTGTIEGRIRNLSPPTNWHGRRRMAWSWKCRSFLRVCEEWITVDANVQLGTVNCSRIWVGCREAPLSLTNNQISFFFSFISGKNGTEIATNLGDIYLSVS